MWPRAIFRWAEPFVVGPGGAALSGALYRAAGRLQLQHGEHAAGADVLARHHHQFQQFGFAEMGSEVAQVILRRPCRNGEQNRI